MGFFAPVTQTVRKPASHLKNITMRVDENNWKAIVKNYLGQIL